MNGQNNKYGISIHVYTKKNMLRVQKAKLKIQIKSFRLTSDLNDEWVKNFTSVFRFCCFRVVIRVVIRVADAVVQ